MMDIPSGSTAAILTARRDLYSYFRGDDPARYRAVSDERAELVRRQPGYPGHESARGQNGFGITAGYWTDAAAACARARHRRHPEIRRIGRERRYVRTAAVVTGVERGYPGRTAEDGEP